MAIGCCFLACVKEYVSWGTIIMIMAMTMTMMRRRGRKTDHVQCFDGMNNPTKYLNNQRSILIFYRNDLARSITLSCGSSANRRIQSMFLAL
jgi:hypothetical protein